MAEASVRSKLSRTGDGGPRSSPACVRKLRLTGGEPLLRRDLEKLVAMLARVGGAGEIGVIASVTRPFCRGRASPPGAQGRSPREVDRPKHT